MIDDDQIEQLARLAHEAYLGLTAGSSKESEACVPWANLPERYRDQNRDQVQHQIEELRYLGYFVIPFNQAGSARPFDPEQHLDDLAVREHTRWMTISIENGYRVGAQRTDAGPERTHPDILTWQELLEESKEKDRQPWRLLPEHLARVGLQAVLARDLLPER